jgi:hypothetical protein
VSNNQTGSLPESEQRTEANFLSYRWTLSASVQHGDPSDARRQQGRGTITTGQTATTGVEDVNEQEVTEADQEQLNGSFSRGPGDAAGDTYGGSAGAQHNGTERHRQGVTGNRGGERADGASMNARMDTIGYATDVILTLSFRLDPERTDFEQDTTNAIVGPLARAFGSTDEDPTVWSEHRVIGQIERSQQQLSRSAARPVGRTLPQRIQ